MKIFRKLFPHVLFFAAASFGFADFEFSFFVFIFNKYDRRIFCEYHVSSEPQFVKLQSLLLLSQSIAGCTE